MKVDYIKVDGEMCILIRDINPITFNMGALNVEHIPNSPFRDPYKIANEIRLQRKIGAIKEIRTQTGWGLKESKEYIDQYMPMGTLRDLDYNIIADKFISYHSGILEGNFLSDDEMKIV